MRKIWLISDTHFGHENIIHLAKRPFASVEEMDAALIDNWNSRVANVDLVYHLGDFAKTIEDAKRVRRQLNGTIRLIVGNHDDIPGLAISGMFQKISLWRKFKEKGILLTHIPTRESEIRDGMINFHGHVHGNNDQLGLMHVDLSVEATDYCPIEWTEIMAIKAARKLKIDMGKKELDGLMAQIKSEINKI